MFRFLITYKKNSLNYRKTIEESNKEINDQNDLIQFNTKLIIKYEHDKHELELANKQKDMEMLHLNNQLKIKMKNDLIKELQKLKRSKDNLGSGVQSVINNLKRQIDDESITDLLQENLDEVGYDFNKRIKQKFPNLSKSEIEILSFIKLKLSNKQIAIQRNTSNNAVDVMLHRLKQKCKFGTTNDLKKYIEEF
jgi:DNA-binding NarL/FixJ family response regulator